MTVLGTKISRKRMLMLLMGLFVVGNLLSALAPAFGLMLAGRVVASLAHGAFFGIGSVVAADLVAPDKRAGAISLMFTGLTVANVVGVPLGTLVGQSLGWRVTFGIVAVLGVIGLLGVARLVPDVPGPQGVRLRHELAALKNVQVLLAMAMTVLGFGGVFAAITYIAPMMTHVAGFADGSVTWLLVLFGLGMVGGNLVGGKYADRALMPLLYVALGALAVVLALFTLTAHHKIAAAVTITLVGALGFATVPRCRSGSWTTRTALPPWPRPSTSAPSTWATRCPPGWAGSSSPPGSATPPPTGSAPSSPRPPWRSPSSRPAWSAASGRPVRRPPARSPRSGRPSPRTDPRYLRARGQGRPRAYRPPSRPSRRTPHAPQGEPPHDHHRRRPADHRGRRSPRHRRG